MSLGVRILAGAIANAFSDTFLSEKALRSDTIAYTIAHTHPAEPSFLPLSSWRLSHGHDAR